MGVMHHIDVELGVIFVKVDGDLRDENVDWWSGAILKDPDYRPGMDRLVDFSGVTTLSLTTDGNRRLATAARRLETSRWGRRIAIVVSGEEGFGVARQYQSMRADAPYEMRLFRQPADAEKWLGVPSGYEPWGVTPPQAAE